MNMKNIPEDKKMELLKALQAVVGALEEEAETTEVNALPEELVAAIEELHKLAAKHDKTFIMAMETHDTDDSSGQCLSCYGTIGTQLKLIISMIQQIAKAVHKPAPDILKDITKIMLLKEFLSDEEDDDASE